MNTQKAQFLRSAADKKGFYRDGRAAVAFAGRSNVGKSSVINSLLNRKNFARVGGTPGKTVQVNYFDVDGTYFIDLPGYGYARVSGDERRRWGVLMEDFFQEPNLFTRRRAHRRCAPCSHGGRRDDGGIFLRRGASVRHCCQ